ncbi:hypothetical protein THITH_12415 [Thioalkalivibrio paradoxus ARh 1]|uniref:Uncharacterized protein n=1 Tax=Thioalkalivibrio paradoxus ARh 1 TaxID=713585 RepID=W0DNQ4_9GAMM|nr:hypothetical protein THITH_12415 [Thioalkalivibrio paradoxus ARh 1]
MTASGFVRQRWGWREHRGSINDECRRTLRSPGLMRAAWHRSVSDRVFLVPIWTEPEFFMDEMQSSGPTILSFSVMSVFLGDCSFRLHFGPSFRIDTHVSMDPARGPHPWP